MEPETKQRVRGELGKIDAYSSCAPVGSDGYGIAILEHQPGGNVDWDYARLDIKRLIRKKSWIC
jgi:hypothetical protein